MKAAGVKSVLQHAVVLWVITHPGIAACIGWLTDDLVELLQRYWASKHRRAVVRRWFLAVPATSWQQCPGGCNLLRRVTRVTAGREPLLAKAKQVRKLFEAFAISQPLQMENITRAIL